MIFSLSLLQKDDFAGALQGSNDSVSGAEFFLLGWLEVEILLQGPAKAEDGRDSAFLVLFGSMQRLVLVAWLYETSAVSIGVRRLP